VEALGGLAPLFVKLDIPALTPMLGILSVCKPDFDWCNSKLRDVLSEPGSSDLILFNQVS
jgi:hypothetical protein